MLKNKVLKVIAIAIVLTTLCSGFASATMDLEDAFIAHVVVGADKDDVVATSTDTDADIATSTDTDVEEDFATATDTEIDADIATGTDTDCDPCEKSCIIADIFEAICNAIKAFFEWLC